MWNDRVIKREGTLFVVSAPSGTGKTTICRGVLQGTDNLSLSVSYTTRMKKETEVDGVDYHFIDDSLFDSMIDNGDFLEYALIYGERYGTSRKSVMELLGKGTDILLEIDVQGGMEVKKILPDSVLVALFPPAPEVLYERLEKRKRDSAGEIEERIGEASRELKVLLNYDYYVLNRDLEKAIEDVILIIKAQSLKVDKNIDFLENIVSKFRR